MACIIVFLQSLFNDIVQKGRGQFLSWIIRYLFLLLNPDTYLYSNSLVHVIFLEEKQLNTCFKKVEGISYTSLVMCYEIKIVMWPNFH